jgi:hypothetical protein
VNSNIVIRATMRGPMMSAPPLDALLGAVIAEERGLVAGFGEMVPFDSLDAPIERSACGRVWLCSFAIFEPDLHECRHLHRRFPIAEAQMLGSEKVRRINISAGVNRSYRIPTRVMHAVGDVVTWYARGDADRVVALLDRVTHLGKKRSCGRGAVASWTVEPCEAWPGFPVLLDGRPLRSLPLDWPGLAADAQRALVVLVPPYWEQRRAEECAVPEAEAINGRRRRCLARIEAHRQREDRRTGACFK